MSEKIAQPAPLWAHSCLDVIRRSCEMHGVEVDDVMGPSRLTQLVDARSAAAWAIRTARPFMSHLRIATMLGRKDHTSSRNWIKRFEDAIDTADPRAACADALLAYAEERNTPHTPPFDPEYRRISARGRTWWENHNATEKSKRMSRTQRYREYRDKVRRITTANKPNVPYSYTIDHIVPVSYGFTHDIPAELIGSAQNLQAIFYQDNIQKGTQITEDAMTLLRKWGYGYLADAAKWRKVG